jgi:hypothetical protein
MRLIVGMLLFVLGAGVMLYGMGTALMQISAVTRGRSRALSMSRRRGTGRRCPGEWSISW